MEDLDKTLPFELKTKTLTFYSFMDAFFDTGNDTVVNWVKIFLLHPFPPDSAKSKIDKCSKITK